MAGEGLEGWHGVIALPPRNDTEALVEAAWDIAVPEDVAQERLDRSLAFDIDHRIDSDTVDPVEEVKRLTGGLGADKTISANPTTAGQQQALAMTRPCGAVVFFGGVPEGALTEIDSNAVHYNSLLIRGHYGANSMQVQRAFELAIDPVFPAEKFITHVLPLGSIDEAIDLARSGEALKVVLQPNPEKE